MTNISKIDIDDATQLLVEETNDALVRAQACVVTTDAGYRDAGEELRIVKGISKALEEARTRLKAPVLEAGRRIDAFFATPKGQLETAEKALKRTMLDYQDAQEQKRKAEAERVRKELEAEERTRREAEAARRREEEAARDAARELEGFGPAIEVKVAPPPAPVRVSVQTPSTTVPRAEGVFTRTVHRARITDRLAIIRAAAAGDELALAVVAIDERALAALATSRRGSLAMPGVEFFEESVLSARSA